MAEIHGEYQDRFAGVAETLSRQVDEGLDIGASVAVFIDGEPWSTSGAATRTRRGREPWERDTIVNVFSTTKTMTALCALILADRGELDLHAPVTRYWPEFGAAGKERDRGAPPARPHRRPERVGRADWRVEDLADWDRCTELLAGSGAVVGAAHRSPATTPSPRAI